MFISKIFHNFLCVFRGEFPVRWSKFLRANYPNPEAVAVHYGVRYATALNWWHAENSPRGDAVALGYHYHPDSAREYLAPKDLAA